MDPRAEPEDDAASEGHVAGSAAPSVPTTVSAGLGPAIHSCRRSTEERRGTSGRTRG